jgi:hypothetical protein
MTTLDILQEILSDITEIRSFTFCKFPKQKLLQERIVFGKYEEVQFYEALQIRDELGLPFWDSMMLTYFGKEQTSDKILDIALMHNSPLEKIVVAEINLIREKFIDNDSLLLALNSVIELKDKVIKHLPLLDFHIPISENNRNQIKKVLKHLGLTNGYLLESGESYHYIGKQMMNIEDLLVMLNKALFFSPIIDKTWIAHQLLEKSCSLRVGIKHSMEPKLIERIYENG